jgi:hypothetical protein
VVFNRFFHDRGLEPSAGKVPGLREGISRRVFLVRGSLVAGAAAAVSSVPGLGNLVTSAEPDAPEISGAASEAAGGAGADIGSDVGPSLVAHVINTSTGEINLYQGATQVIVRSPALAQAIARLAVSKG